MTFWRIGELARRADVGVETVRYYMRQGLLADPQQPAAGYRGFDEEDLRVLQFIRRAKDVGFTLKEIKSLLALRADQSASRTEVRQRAQTKILEIESQIADLQRMRDVLQSLLGSCHGNGSVAGCPILSALQGPGTQ